jgi:homoserine kinase
VEADLPLVACLPEDIVVSTRDARGVVPESASIDELVDTVGRAATLTTGMHRGDPELVGHGMEDDVVTPARAALIEGYDAVRTAALDAGAEGVTVSGAGPAMLAVCEADRQGAIASAMLDAFDDSGVEARVYQTRIGRGAEVLEDSGSV